MECFSVRRKEEREIAMRYFLIDIHEWNGDKEYHHKYTTFHNTTKTIEEVGIWEAEQFYPQSEPYPHNTPDERIWTDGESNWEVYDCREISEEVYNILKNHRI